MADELATEIESFLGTFGELRAHLGMLFLGTALRVSMM